MAKDPAFLFYPGDWLGGTIGMTFEEKGAYMELLMMQFTRGHMTERMIHQTVGQLWVNLKDKFEKDAEGLWFNNRLDVEKEKRKNYVDSRKNNKKGSNQHTSKPKKQKGHMTSHMEDVNEDRNDNEYFEGGTGETFEKEKKEVVSALMLEFGFTEIRNFDKMRELWEFVNDVSSTKGISVFIETFKAYKKWKEISGHEMQGYRTFISGGWDSDNWQFKIDNFKPHGSKPDKMTETVEAFANTPNPFRT